MAQVVLSPVPSVYAAGASSRCRVRLRLRDGTSLAIEDRGADPQAAAAHAAWRLEHRLERQRDARPATHGAAGRHRPGLR